MPSSPLLKSIVKNHSYNEHSSSLYEKTLLKATTCEVVEFGVQAYTTSIVSKTNDFFT